MRYRITTLNNSTKVKRVTQTNSDEYLLGHVAALFGENVLPAIELISDESHHQMFSNCEYKCLLEKFPSDEDKEKLVNSYFPDGWRNTNYRGSPTNFNEAYEEALYRHQAGSREEWRKR